MKKINFSRSDLSFPLLLWGAYLFICCLQRLVFAGWVLIETKTVPPRFLIALAKGCIFDLAVGFFLFFFATLLILLTPRNWKSSRIFKVSLLFFSAFPLLLALFLALAEGFFFNEFHARFNFIAVDYLVYTHEVIRNIWESYPIVWFLLGLFALATPIVIFIKRQLQKIRVPQASLRQRAFAGGTLAFVGLLAFALTEDRLLSAEPYWTREISKNSLFALFSAYNRNSIDFHEFYTSLDSNTANHLAHEWLEEEVGESEDHLELDTEDETSIVRNIKRSVPQKDWNVVLVIIESLSARFMHHYDPQTNITPNLDRLADDGLFFSKIYATGTRTVRGLEALMLSMPPTPGQSILRRPKSDGIFNLGNIFSQNGYNTQFIYGGYSYFDNMKEWFSSNGFEIVDRSVFPEKEIQFANAWGVCDEDLFDQVLKQADHQYANQQPFFQAVLTTSNHRPYTYPEGRIDIPSHTGRDGAVKYTDYAIGRFVEMAKAKPWFNKTLFIFVADHNASVAGGTDIPIRDYLVPMIFYNPNLISSGKIEKLGSQIDLAPTLLGLMGFNYQSRFFGQNLFHAKAGRAVLGTYQKVALLEDGRMTVLSPGYTIESQTLDADGNITHTETIKTRDASQLSEEKQKTVSIYQSASELFSSGQLKTNLQLSRSTNIRNF